MTLTPEPIIADDVEWVGEQVMRIVTGVVSALDSAGTTKSQDAARLFFAQGVELTKVVVAVGDEVRLEFAGAGRGRVAGVCCEKPTRDADRVEETESPAMVSEPPA